MATVTPSQLAWAVRQSSEALLKLAETIDRMMDDPEIREAFKELEAQDD